MWGVWALGVAHFLVPGFYVGMGAVFAQDVEVDQIILQEFLLFTGHGVTSVALECELDVRRLQLFLYCLWLIVMDNLPSSG